MDSPELLIIGLVCVYGALATAIILFLKSRRIVPLERRRPDASGSASTLSRLTTSAVASLNKTLQGKQIRFITADKFQQAGLRIRGGDFLIMCSAGVLVGGILGFLLAGLGMGVLFAICAPAVMLVWLNAKAARRRSKFADQLPDTLQLLAGGMRAGHSLLRAVDGAAKESQAPMADELSRVVAETRLGRDLSDSLLDVAGRTASQDFLWVAQGIEVHREVGGDLAEVLDNINETIRDRDQLRRQVKAISAEGRVSAYVLVALPIVIFLALNVVNPSYARILTTTFPGWIMLVAAALLLAAGSFWLSRLIKPKF